MAEMLASGILGSRIPRTLESFPTVHTLNRFQVTRSTYNLVYSHNEAIQRVF